MTNLAKAALSKGNTVALDAHAKATLRYIRSSMDAASLVTTPGSAGIAAGAVGVAAALLAAGPLQDHWLGVWIASAPVAAVLSGAVMARQQRLHGRTLFGASGRRFVLALAPAIVAGAVLTIASLHYGNERLIAGTWLLLYGSAVTAASATTVRSVGWLGGLFMLLGALALAVPMSEQNLVLASGFGALHLMFGGYLIWRNSHER